MSATGLRCGFVLAWCWHGPHAQSKPAAHESSLPTLRAQLRSGAVESRNQALLTLASLGPRAAPAVPDIFALLGQPGDQRPALEALAAIGAVAVPELVRAVTSGGPAVDNALIALRHIGPSAAIAVPEVVRILDRGGFLANRAEQALGTMGAAGVAALLQYGAAGDRDRADRVRWSLASGAARNPAAEAALVRMRFADDEDVRRQVESMLASPRSAKGSPEAVMAWVEHARAGDLTRSGIALGVLERLGGRAAPAVPFLVERLAVPTEPHRTVVARALAGAGAKGRTALLELGRSERDDSREWAVIALGYRGEAAIPDLISALGDGDERVRWRAICALERIGSPAVTPLRKALTTTDPAARAGVQAALERIER